MILLNRNIFKQIHVLKILPCLFLVLSIVGGGLVPCLSLASEGVGKTKVTPVATTAQVYGADQNVSPEEKIDVLATLDNTQEYFSKKLFYYAKNMDKFFGGERYFQEGNNSVVQLELQQTAFASGSKNGLLILGKAKLDLPSAQQRFHLILESNPDQKTAGEIKKDQPGTTTSAKPEQYSAALRYDKSEEGLWYFGSDVGAKLQTPIDPFVRARGSYTYPLEQWRMKLAETVFWFSTVGLGETTLLDMERLLSPAVLFRASTTISCFKTRQDCDSRQDLNVFQTLSDRAALQYQASYLDITEPDLIETKYILLLRYRYRLHQNWLFYEIVPQLNFSKAQNSTIGSQLQLRLEMLFGAVR